MLTSNTRSDRPRRTPVRAVLLLAALGGLLAVVPSVSAGAAPIDDLRAQAAQLEGQMNTLSATLGALHEQIRSDQDQIDSARQQIADAQRDIVNAQSQVDSIMVLVRQRAATVYRSAGLNGVGEFETDIREQASRRKYANATSERDDHLLDQLDQAKEDLAVRQAIAERLRDEVQKRQDVQRAREAEYASQRAELDRLKSGIDGQIASLVAEEQARRRAAEAAAVAAARPPASRTSGGGGASTFDPSKVPAASGRAGVAVAFAAAQVGKPYCNDGNRKGPDCYDCSGLTQQAWAAAGVSIPGSSGSQYGAFPRVPMDQLQPGDLVFFPDPGSHVGLYAGGGSVISASTPGDVVKYHPLSLYTSAVRPG
jgi:cell wall-associated NlpC family hydrolase